MARLLPTQHVAVDEDIVLLPLAPSKSSKRTNGAKCTIDPPAENSTGSFRCKSGGNKGGGLKGGSPAAGMEGAISSFIFNLCQTSPFMGEEGQNMAGGASRSQEKSLWDSDACKDYSEDGYGASRRHCDQ